jgi:Na+/melibiose symporter-like transporter
VAVNKSQKPALLYTLAALIFLEGAALAAATVYLVVEIFVGDPRSVTTAIAYAVTAAVVAVLVLFVGRATLVGRPWIRGATVCIAVLQLLVAYSILITKEPTLGWVLAVPAIVLLVLLFTRPVLRATARPSRDDEDERTF